MSDILQQITAVNCPKCGKNTVAVWAANPPEENLLFCPDCFRPVRSKQGNINFPYSLFFGQPTLKDQVWSDQPATTFSAISHFIEVCIGKIPAGVNDIATSDHSTLDEMMMRLHDFVADPTEVPYWHLKIETAETVSAQISKRTIVSELKSNIQFWKSRIEYALMPGSSVIAAKQLLQIQHLKTCMSAWKLGEPLPQTPPAIVEVNWELLEPDGTGIWERLIGHHDKLKKSYGGDMDETRLKLLYDKKPDLIFVGRSKFDGYVVFVFSRRDIAFLDSAFLGNALYIMKASEWKDLSKLSKSELLFDRHAGVERIIHSSRWANRLQRLFNKYKLS